MAGENTIQTPGVFGGLMRYDEEIGSKLQFSPVQVIGFVVIILLFVLGLRLFFS